MGNIKIVRGVFDTKLELEHAGVAAGAVVTRDVEANTIVGGVPAKLIKRIK